MSLAFRITNNFQDNADSNALKKAKMEDGQARATQQGQKRAALGTITNNAGLRIQPFRAAKQQVSEPLSISPQNFQNFKFHVRFVSVLEKRFFLIQFLSSFKFRLAWPVLRFPSELPRTTKMHSVVHNKRPPSLYRRLHSKVSPFT